MVSRRVCLGGDAVLSSITPSSTSRTVPCVSKKLPSVSRKDLGVSMKLPSVSKRERSVSKERSVYEMQTGVSRRERCAISNRAVVHI